MILEIPIWLYYIWTFGLLASFAMCLYRIARGPTAADRIVATDILGILVIGFCVFFAIFWKRTFFLDVGLAWGLLGFIGAITLAKYLEGKNFDE